MILLLDIGNTHTHLGLADGREVRQHTEVPTRDWFAGRAGKQVQHFARRARIEGIALASVVPRATVLVRRAAAKLWNLKCLELSARTLRGIGISYPRPETIGADRLANAVAALRHFGAPCVVIDFGTAVTFDVVDRSGNFAGGIIAPGLGLGTDYLHEKTALLPRIRIQKCRARIGTSTREAMLIGAVVGFRGAIRELLAGIKQELSTERLPVIATGGYAKFAAAALPEITAVEPRLTLEGLRLVWAAHTAASDGRR